jgi:hypothetical protein
VQNCVCVCVCVCERERERERAKRWEWQGGGGEESFELTHVLGVVVMSHKSWARWE